MSLEASFDGSAGRTWYRVVGDLGAGPAPLVVLHGGPGAAHDYLESLERIETDTGRPCVFYDQIGCGRSEHRPDAPPGFWTVELFRRELVELLAHLGISGAYHVLGQSWGGMLGLEHALEQPAGLQSLILANSLASMPMWIAETARLRAELPSGVRAVLDHHEAADSTDSPEYAAAVRVFYDRHLCRVPWTPGMERSFAQIDEDPTVYGTMNGPSEFHVVGTLADWDVTARLGEVAVPVLVVSGEHDEATPAVVAPIVEGLPDARWELIEGASHSPHLETPERFFAVVEAFLAGRD